MEVKRIAIVGHKTRGKEVIEILEMLGGNNPDKHTANCDYLGFFIGKETRNIYATHLPRFDSEKVIIYTLEEFLKKFPYKVGDKVQRKGATYCDPIYEVEKMQWVDNHVEYTTKHCWYNSCHNTFTAEYLQPYKEETMEEKLCIGLFPVSNGRKEIIPCDGYKVISEKGKFYVVKKLPQYPKTYEECCEVLFPDSIARGKVLTSGYNGELLKKLGELLICRDAYWKIAKDWEEKRKEKAMHYVICSTLLGEVVKDTMPNCIANYILDFPTEEMRDTFYENFNVLIEICKELL